MKRASVHFKLWAKVCVPLAKGYPVNLNPKPTTAFAGKISRGIDKLFDDPDLFAQRFSMLLTNPKPTFFIYIFLISLWRLRQCYEYILWQGGPYVH